VREVLKRMSGDPKAHLDADLAHEIAVRDNIKTYLTGEISEAGGRYVVAAKLIGTTAQNTLASYRETARDSSEIIHAVDRLSKKLRTKIGESLRTIRAEKPLEAVSTPSLDALRKYTEATRLLDVEQDYDAAISLLQEAIEADSSFAMAWRKLAVAYFNSGRGRELQLQASTKAYQYRDRLTDLERYAATGYYFQDVQDWNKSISAYRMVMERDPTWAPNNLGLVYMQVREFKKAADTFQRATEIDSTLTVAHANLIRAYQSLGDNAAVDRALALYARRFGHRADLAELETQVSGSRGQWDAAEKSARAMLEAQRTNLVWRARANTALSDLAQVRGRLDEADRLRAEATAANFERGNVWAPLNAALSSVRTDILVRLDANVARARLDAALQQHPLKDIPALNRPYLLIAQLYAQIGQAQQAREYIAQYEAAIPSALRGDDSGNRAEVDGFIALHDQRYDEAIRQLRRGSEIGVCIICGETELALAFDRTAQPDSAIAHYEKYLSTPFFARLREDLTKRGPTYERLAELYEKRGDRAKAIDNATHFIELWRNADPELQPRVNAKRELIARLRGAG
jgi:predicted Zn-dependent protease